MRFVKMEGIGNDYIYINGAEEKIDSSEYPALARAVSDRHFGIGADGLIVVLPSDKADFRMRMFNADGSEGEMCGNGIRCFAKYVYDRGLTKKETITVDSLAGIVVPEVRVGEDGKIFAVRVDMGEPRLSRAEIPMIGPDEGPVIDEVISFGDHQFAVTAVSMGNPHAVTFCEDIDSLNLEHIGPRFEHHPAFPKRVNAHFVQVLGPEEIRMRSWERGSGITLACGTGACASVVASVISERGGRNMTVHLPGGALQVEWAPDNHVYMTGPANEVCNGTFTKKW